MVRTYCPECQEPLSSPGASRCAACNWKDRKPGSGGPPDTAWLVDKCMAYLMTVPAEKYPRSLPSNPADGARFWVEKCSKPLQPGDKPKLDRNRDKEASMGWRWPYGDLVRLLLARFCRSDEQMQRLIIAASEDEIFWQGEPHELLLSIINETELQRGLGVDDYRKHAVAKLKEALAGAVAQ